MTTVESAPSEAPAIDAHVLDDPLRAFEPFPFRQTFYPLGFPLEIETNHTSILEAAKMSWPAGRAVDSTPALRLKIGVSATDRAACPPSPRVRAQGHLLCITSDAENFIVSDLRAGFAFGWVSAAALLHPGYLRYNLLEAAVMTLLSSRHLTPLHAACVSLAGQGLLLSGRSGAGKSTLAYACARQGWTYTCDDAANLLWNTDELRVRGNSRQFRFRPTARQFFPELQGRSVTPRSEGKPSIEVPTADFPGILVADEVPIHAFIVLDRCASPLAELTPIPHDEALPLLEQLLFPLPEIRELQRPSVRRLLRAEMYTLHYRDVGPAIAALRDFVAGQLT